MIPDIPSANQLPCLAEAALGKRWELLLDVADIAAQDDLRVYIVGGMVRDLLLGVTPRDPDLVVEGSAPDLARTLVAQRGGSHLLHTAFQTATWTDPQGQALDIVSARKERYPTPAALPVVEPGNLEEDLKRRDFSLNAMALSLHPKERGALHDPCGGLGDLADRRLRILHTKSFHDDPTRAWRGARLAARLGLQLGEESHSRLSEALENEVFSLLGLERLGAELDRITREPIPGDVLQIAASWGLLESSIGLSDASGWINDLQRFQPASSEIFWLCLARQISMQERQTRIRMVPGAKREQVRWLHGPEKIDTCLKGLEDVDSASQAGRLLEDLDEIELKLAEQLASPVASKWIRWWQEKGQGIKSAVDGELLLAHGAQPGPLLGVALRTALDIAREGESRERQLQASLKILGEAGRECPE